MTQLVNPVLFETNDKTRSWRMNMNLTCTKGILIETSALGKDKKLHYFKFFYFKYYFKFFWMKQL